MNLWLNGAQARGIERKRITRIFNPSTIDAREEIILAICAVGDNRVVNQATTQLMQGEEKILALSTKGEL